MQCKRRRAHSSGRVVVDGDEEIDDFGCDMRLLRRWKRRRIANQEFKRNSGGTNSCSDGKFYETPKKIPETKNIEIDILDDDDDDLVDADYQKYLESLALQAVDDSHVSNNRSLDNGDIGGDALNGDAHNNDTFDYGHPQSEKFLESNNTEIDDGKGGEFSDDDYESFLRSLASEPFVDTGVNSNAVNKSVDNGDIGNDVLVENRTVNIDAHNNDAFNDGDPQHEAILESNNIEVDDNKEDGDYGKYLHGLHSEPFVDGDVCHDNFVDDGFNTNAVHPSVESGGTSGDELVENEHVDYAAAACNNNNNNDDDNNNNNSSSSNNNNNHIAFSDMDPQSKKIPERNNIKIDDDYKKYLDGCDLGLSGDSDVSNGCSVDAAAVDINSVYQSKENRTCGNQSIENGTTDAESVEARSPNNDSDHNDDLDDVDPQFKLFLENFREDGKSYVVEIPMNDGISVIHKYEQDNGPHDSCRVEIPDTMRPSQAAPGTTKHDCKHEMEQDVDENYKIFLHSMKQEGKYLVFRPESGGKVVYDADEESSSDSEVIVMDSDPFADGNYTPFVTSKSKRYDVLEEDGNGGLKNLSSNDCSWFREKVVEILKKPYDEKEYHELLEEVLRRRLVKEERDMRNGRIRVYSAQRLGPSYLELHKDLARNIKKAGSSKPKILNLLRGFFYWLQNVAHDGVFKPWTDLSCLEVLPHGKSKISIAVSEDHE